MRIIFTNKKLETIYTTGKSLQYNKSIISSFIDKVTFIAYAPTIQHIRAMKSLHLEQLQGKMKGKRSIRLNKQYRLMFSLHTDGSYTIVHIEKISKHYE